MAAHKIAIELTINPEDLAVQSKLREIESQINAAVAKLWGLQKEEVESVQSALTLIAHLPMVKKKPSRDEAVAESAQASLAISGG